MKVLKAQTNQNKWPQNSAYQNSQKVLDEWHLPMCPAKVLWKLEINLEIGYDWKLGDSNCN